MIKSIKLENQGTVNKNIVYLSNDVRTIKLYFSYETIIAVSNGYNTYCRQNDWSVTTGKFLNEIEPDYFSTLAGKFDLVEEFKENGII